MAPAPRRAKMRTLYRAIIKDDAGAISADARFDVSIDDASTRHAPTCTHGMAHELTHFPDDDTHCLLAHISRQLLMRRISARVFASTYHFYDALIFDDNYFNTFCCHAITARW